MKNTEIKIGSVSEDPDFQSVVRVSAWPGSKTIWMFFYDSGEDASLDLRMSAAEARQVAAALITAADDLGGEGTPEFEAYVNRWLETP